MMSTDLEMLVVGPEEARPEELGDAATDDTPSHQWASYRYLDGVSIFTEKPEEGEEGPPAIMLSMIVRAPPEMCMKVRPSAP